MHTTLIIGSVRQGRESVKPARYVASKLIEYGHTVTVVDLADLDLPVFHDTPEQMALPGVRKLIDSVVAAEAIVLVFPEYNHDVGSGLRNGLSFIRKREFLHKPLGLVAASNGQYGGMRALYAAKASFPTLGGVIMPTVVGVDVVQDTFPDEATVTNPKIAGQIESLIRELAAYAPALKKVRAELTAR